MKIYIYYIRNALKAISPLHFGAGVKSKILEVAHNQIPLITTSIGGEWLDQSIRAFIVEDNAEKKAKKIS